MYYIQFFPVSPPWISDEIWNPWRQSFDSPSLSDVRKKGAVELILLDSLQIFLDFSPSFLTDYIEFILPSFSLSPWDRSYLLDLSPQMI